MAMFDDLGSALTGNTGGETDPATAAGQWDDWLQRPGNRSALLQLGLGLMQPVGIGQTVGGHVAQAIGGAGEAVTRNDIMDLKERQADAKLEDANERLAIARQNANTNAFRASTAASRATGRKVGGLTDAIRARFAREDARNYEKQLDSDAKAIAKQAADPLADPNDPNIQRYKSMTVPQIREELRKTRPAPKYGNIPSNDTSTGEDDDEDTSGAGGPPVPGARLARDGNWYVNDPKRPGKYLRVE